VHGASGGQGALFEKTARAASGPLQKLFIKGCPEKWTLYTLLFGMDFACKK